MEDEDAMTLIHDALEVEPTGRVRRLIAMARRIREVTHQSGPTIIKLMPATALAVAADFEELAMLIGAPPTGDDG